MNKPTKEEYEKAKKDMSFFNDCICRCKKEQNKLLDELITNRNSEKFYTEALEKVKETILIYELYKDVEK